MTMACNHSDAAVDTHKDGHTPLAVGYTPLAVVVSQGMGDIETANFDVCLPSNIHNPEILTIENDQINGTFPFNDLPIELQNKIIGYAMTATDQEIVFSCLTNAGYTPNVTVGLLLVNHRIYHEAHYQLRKQNTFIFGNFGSDLKTIASSIGPFKCRSGACGYSPLHSLLANVRFNLGDEELPDHADDKVHAFGCALRYLRSEINVGSLHIQLSYHTFSTNTQLSSFASALTKVKVQDTVTIMGDEKYLDMSFGDLPGSLGMNAMPVYSHLEPYNPNIQYSPGCFHHRYEREKHVGKDAGPQDKCLVVA